jgi:hypothetical protein
MFYLKSIQLNNDIVILNNFNLQINQKWFATMCDM